MASQNLVITSLRGGMNDTDVPTGLPNDQCVLANNVEFYWSLCGERRKGCSAISLAGSNLTNGTAIVSLSQRFPTNDVTLPELWAASATIGSAVYIDKRSTGGVWAGGITPTDTPVNTSPDVYYMTQQDLNGLTFWSYHSAIDRLHVWDGTTLRKSGLAQPPAAPTAVDTGSGSFSGIRYYRVRYTQMTGSVINRRSEPSLALSFTPSGSGVGALITRPATVGEGETNWELEASTDNANFYVIATLTIGTTTYTDTQDFTIGYSAFPLSDAVGAYLTIPSYRYMVADSDRLVLAGHWTDLTKMSQVAWTPVTNDPGVGNSERLPIVTTGGDNITTNTNLDNYDGGRITGLSSASYGTVYVFKWNRIYRLSRTGDDTRAYIAVRLTSSRGAIPGSVVSGIDETGQPCIYFLDPVFGPSRLTGAGAFTIKGLRTTWRRVNTFAANVVAKAVYYPDKQQVWWWVAADANDSPTLGLKLQVTEQKLEADGSYRGWSLFDGRIAQALCVTNLNEKVTNDPDFMVQLRSRPLIGLTGPDYICECDTGFTDNGTIFKAKIRTKPYLLTGILNMWGTMVAGLLASPNPTFNLNVKLLRDFGKEGNQIVTDLLPEASEDYVIKVFDNLVMSESKSIQVEISDP